MALTHVFAGTDRHGAAAAQLAGQWREQLLAGADPSTLGDPFLRGREFTAVTERDLAGIFGSAFAAQVMRLPVGQLVGTDRVELWHARRARRAPTLRATTRRLAEVRTAVSRDWHDEHRAAADRAALVRLRQRYDIRIDGQAGTAQASEVPPAARGEAKR